MSDNTESAAIAAGFLRYLENAGKRALLPEVLAILQREVSPKLPELIVESSVALSDTDKQEILRSLTDREHSGNVQFRVNPALIGGLKITHGDQVLDLSVQNKLKKVYA